MSGRTDDSTAFQQWMSRSEQGRGVPPLVDEAVDYESNQQQSHALCRGLAIVLEHHNCPVSVTLQALDQVCEYLDKSRTPKEWLKGAKYLLAYPLAAHLKQNDTPPVPPHGEFRPRSAFRRWMKQRICCFNRRNNHLWYSWLQSKRAALPASDEIVEEVYMEHFETLSSPDVGDDVVIQRVFDNPIFQRVLDDVRSAVTKNTIPTLDQRTSLSASFESTRAEFGQHGYLSRAVGLTLSDEIQRELGTMLWFPVAYFRGERRTNVCLEWKLPLAGSEKWCSLTESLSEWRVTRRGLPCSARIQGVLEPLKVRVISKGEALPYYHARGLQEAMHDCMRQMPCFRLIGRPLSPTDLLDLVKRDEWLPDPLQYDRGLENHSVDYRGATDGISWKYTGKILNHVISGLPWLDQIGYNQVLGPHRLIYPPKKVDGLVPPGAKERDMGMQTTGQLMGSILSFVILCLGHLGLILEVLRPRCGEDPSILDRLLINGDDGVYRGTEEEWVSHKELGNKLGLFMSVGKAYRHKTFLNINSACYHLRPEVGVRGTVVEIPFLNTGLILGQSKVMTGASSDRGLAESHHEYENDLIPNLNEILRGALPNKADSLLKFVMNFRGADLQRECLAEVRFERRKVWMTRNLFIHTSLGGMGVRPPPGWKWSITEKQKLLAYSILESNDAQPSFGAPTPGPELEEPKRPNLSVRTVDFDLEQERGLGSVRVSVPWDKMMKSEVFPDIVGRIRTYSRKSAKWFQVGVRWCATNPECNYKSLDNSKFCAHRYVDVTKSSIVHGVAPVKTPKTVPTSTDDAAELVGFQEWLNSSVLSPDEVPLWDLCQAKFSVLCWFREGFCTREEYSRQRDQLDHHHHWLRIQRLLARYEREASVNLSFATRGFIELNSGSPGSLLSV